jgi:hypothetical protein
VTWAQRIVARYEAGYRVPAVSKQAAMQVLGLKPGSLLRGGCNPRDDRLSRAAQAE